MVTAVVHDISTNGEAYYTRCNGTSYTSPRTSFNASTVIDPINNSIVRSAPVIKTAIDADGFRPYTNYSCSGRRYSGNPVGKSHRVTINSLCPIKNSTLAVTDRYYGSLLASITLGNYTDPGYSLSEKDQLLTQAYADVEAGLFDASTNLGELPEIVKLLAKCRQRVLECFEQTARHAIRVQELDRYFRLKGTKGVILDIIEALSNLWLEWRYGWRPLAFAVRDLNSAIVALKLPGSAVRSGMAQKVKPISRTVSFTQTSYSTLGKQDLQMTAVTRRVNRASVAGVLSPRQMAFSADLLGTAFELYPLSFVLGWLADVESWLRSWTRLPRDTKLTYCVSSWVGSTINIKGVAPAATSNNTWYYHQPIDVEFEDFSYSRVVVNGFTPRIATQFDLSLGDDRVTDLVFLLVQRLIPGLRS